MRFKIWFFNWKYKRYRRKLEYRAFAMQDPKWHRIKEENERLGVWK